MSIRYRNPETVKLEISQGDWLLVKKYLTAGEHRRRMTAMLNPDRNQIEPVNVGMSAVVAFLLDWSIDGLDGKRMVIADKSDVEKVAILDNLPSDVFTEIIAAVEAHEDRINAERDAAKNNQDGVTQSSPISPSVSSSGGVTPTLTTSTLMSIAS